MTDFFKLGLVNQYEILKRLDPKQEEEYDLLIHCLLNGYEKDFNELKPHFGKPLLEEVRLKVRDILGMFRALGPSWEQGHRIPAVARFVGFDGNDEPEYYEYARFLIEDRGLWSESRRDSYNTHSGVLGDYENMLCEWETCTDKNRLTDEEKRRVANVAPYTSRRDLGGE